MKKARILPVFLFFMCIGISVAKTGSNRFESGFSENSFSGNEQEYSFAGTFGKGSDSVNIAVIAKPTTSFVSDWETLAAVNDGYTPANSNDKTHGAYGNWDHPNSVQWVQYTWAQSYIIKSIQIYWFDDAGGVLTPTEAYIEYNNGLEWIKAGDVPCVKNTFNFLTVGGITTDKIRVSMLNPTQSTGILEFRVWGTTLSGGTDIQAPTAPGTPQIKSVTDTSIVLVWKSSTDNIGVSGYQVLRNDTAMLTVPDTTATLKGLIQGKNYLFSVKSFDEGGNYSVASGSVWSYFGTVANVGDPYTWPSYSPTLNYKFTDEYPSLSEPSQVLDDCPEVVGTQSSGWWTFRWGPTANTLVTPAAITPMLARMNKDFAYFRDTLGWPPDKRAKRGYKSAIYLYGSGLSTDDASNTDKGGWQSSINYGGEEWPMVLISYYPVYCFNPSCSYSDREYQTSAVVHEGIHSILADMPGCKNAAWFHEGGNTWLQQEAESRRSGNYSSMGFLNGCTFLAPFMPIECYSGWLQDGSFGGPSAEGVNKTQSDGTQLCTWRTYLGGNQYGNAFPTFISQVLGTGSVAWIWRNCPTRVLEGMAEGLGDMQMRRLIMEYRAKQAMIDMKKWNGAIKKLLDDNFRLSIGAEWQPSWLTPASWSATPYAKTTNDGNGLLTPEYRTTPGWSGANQIPLRVSGDMVVVNFRPIGVNMTCQLCYRATDGTAVYSNPVSSGDCSLRLDKKPKNGVVIAVICNTDYVYKGEATRRAHYDYRLQLVDGVAGTAGIYYKWYDYQSSIIDDVNSPVDNSGDNQDGIKVFPNPVTNGEVNIEFEKNTEGVKLIKILNLSGQLLYSDKVLNDSQFIIPTKNLLTQGIYLLSVQAGDHVSTFKILIPED
jgi:chitodextrinase